MNNQQIYNRAKNDFNKAVKNLPEKELKSYLPGFGISAMKFATRYTCPNENKPLYDKIYNIYYNYFNNLK